MTVKDFAKYVIDNMSRASLANSLNIATKLDKIKRSQIQKNTSIIRKKLKAVENTPIIPFSALTKQGRDEIWEFIEDYMEYEDSLENGNVE